MRYLNSLWILITLVSFSAICRADAPAAPLAPSVKESLPRAYRDLHPTEAISLTFLTHKNIHRAINPIFTDDWTIRPSRFSTTSVVIQTGVGDAGRDDFAKRLARVTAYWPGEAGDYYTSIHMSSTGVHLHVGHCAVDPKIIPYGSVVEIPGVGTFLAVDTGSAVVSRMAARASGHTVDEKGALVIDLYFATQSDGEAFAAHGPSFAKVNWWTPGAAGVPATLAVGPLPAASALSGPQVASVRE